MPLPALLGMAGRALASGARVATGVGAGGNVIDDVARFGFNLQGIQAVLTSTTGALKAVGGAMATLPVKPVEAFAAAVKLTQAPLTVAAANVEALAGAVVAVQAPALAVVGSVKSLVGAVGALGTATSEFVRLASPIHVQKFNLAMDDLTASFGRVMIPLLEASTDAVRAFADTVFGLSEPLTRLVRSALDPFVAVIPRVQHALEPVVVRVGKIADQIATALKPLANIAADRLASLLELAADKSDLLVASLTPLIASLTAAAAVIDGLDRAMTAVMATGSEITKLFGASPKSSGKPDEKPSDVNRLFAALMGARPRTEPGPEVGRSVYAAARPTTIGSVEDYQRRAQQAAFSLGTAATDVRAADAAENLYDYFNSGKFVRELKEAIKGLIPDLPSLPDVSGDGGVDKIIERSKEAARGIQDRIDEADRQIRRFLTNPLG